MSFLQKSTIRILKTVIGLAGVFLLLMSLNCQKRLPQEMTQTMKTPPLKGQNDYYIGNQPPLIKDALIKLPVGSIQPQGWIRHQLELMAQGFTGHLDEISPWCTYKGNAWVDPQGRGKHGWEEVPYWLRGFISLGYILKNQRIIDEAERWVEGVGVKINGEKINIKPHPQSWIYIKRMWKNKDRVQVEFPLSTTITTLEKNKNSVSVSRGPLTYSLKIGERWVRYNDSEKWPAYEVFPTTH